MHTIFKPTQSIIAQVASLSELPMKELYTLWEKYHDSEAPSQRKPLVRRLAFKIQQSAFEKANPDKAKEQRDRINNLMTHCEGTPKVENTIIPGAILSRTYRGKTYEVIVHSNNKYEFEGRVYTSLSRIATEITGTKWSGPKFFGTNKVKPLSKNGNKA